jgi:hypothetical protein
MCWGIFKRKKKTEQAGSSKVPFSTTNATKCVCGRCPVQAKSKCVSDKMGNIQKALTMNPIRREDIPGLYCSSGIATCKDTDTKQGCICGTCPLWAEYKLAGGKPQGYFCRDGSAK